MAGRPPIDLNQKVRDLLKHTVDDRFKLFSAKGDSLASHFNAGSVGRAMCESDTWLSNQTINERFRQILKPHFDKPWEYLFPAENDLPTGERARAKTLEILWQVRHNITHNTGFLTDSDARRLTLMVKARIVSGETLSPNLNDLRYVKRFLVETASHTNDRIGKRLADLLTERHQDDPTLFVPLDLANSISGSFQKSLTINDVMGFI